MIADTRSTLREFRAELSKLHRDALLYFCALANNLLFRDPRRFDTQMHNEFVRRFLPTDILNNVARRRGGPQCVVFNRRQLLFLAKEALFNCSVSGRLWHPQDESLGKVLLMANDQLEYDLPSTTDPLEDLIQNLVQFLPVGESSGPTDFQHKLIRPFLMVTQFLPSERKGLYFDVPDLFHKAVGLPVTTYWALVFSIITRFQNFDLNTFARDRNSFGLDEAWYRTTKISQEHLSCFFDEISFDPNLFATRIAPPVDDLSCFKAKPMYRRAGRIYPIDFYFGAVKCDSGVFWEVHNSLSDNDRPRFHQFWGEVFERYLNWLFANTVDNKRNLFIPNPRYSGSHEQVCDSIVICGSEAAFIEYKGSTFTAAAKYGGSTTRLRSEIESKLIGTPDNKKGPRQLAEAIRRVALAPKGSVDGVDLSRIVKFYPVLVTRDDLGGSMFINEYLNIRFQSLIGRKEVFPRVLTPLFCFSADEIELIATELRVVRMTSILEARHNRDPSLTAPFALVENAAMRGRTRELPQILKDALRNFTDMVKDECFSEWRKAVEL